MEGEIRKDEKFWNIRWSFVTYCMLDHIVLLLEKHQKRFPPPGVAESIEEYKKHLSSCEQEYLNYKKWIFSKFRKSGVETVLGIAFSHAVKKGRIIADLTNTPPTTDVPPNNREVVAAIEDECADVCASLAKWEYEARHFKHIRWVAYTTAFVLSVSGIVSLIDLLGKWVPLWMS